MADTVFGMMLVNYNGNEYLLQFNDHYLSLDAKVRAKHNVFAVVKEAASWSRYRDISLTDVESIEVDSIENAGSRWDGWRFSSGLLHGSQKTPNVTGVLVKLKSGEHLMMAASGKAPIEVRAVLGPVLEKINGSNNDM